MSPPNAVSERRDIVGVLSRGRLLAGARYLAFFTAIGLGAVFFATASEDTIKALSGIDGRWFILAVLVLATDIWLGAWRNHLLISKIKPGTTPWLCLRAQLANEFAAAITPGQSGGMPAWLYILHRGGIEVSSAISVSVLVFLSTLVFFEVSTILAALHLGGNAVYVQGLSPGIVARYSVAICTVVMILIVASFLLPERQLPTFKNSATRPSRTSASSVRTAFAGVIMNLSSGIKQYQTSAKRLLQLNKAAVLSSFVVTLLYYFGKLNLAYLIFLGLGVRVDYVTALAVLALLRFIIYFSPTPGGSGIGEVSIAALTAGLMPIHLLPLYTVAYRTLHLFLPALFGAAVLLGALRKTNALPPTPYSGAECVMS